jgi:hypothetical protein
MRTFFAFGFSLALVLLWLIGLIASIWHPSRGRWRRYAIAAFALLLGSRVLTTAYLVNGVVNEHFTWESRVSLLQIQDLLQVLGAGMIVLALITGRSQASRRPQASEAPGQLPPQQPPPRDR